MLGILNGYFFYLCLAELIYGRTEKWRLAKYAGLLTIGSAAWLIMVAEIFARYL